MSDNYTEHDFDEFVTYINQHNLADEFPGMGHFDSFADVVEMVEGATGVATIGMYTDPPEIDYIQVTSIREVKTVARLFDHVDHEGPVDVQWDADSAVATVVIDR